MPIYALDIPDDTGQVAAWLERQIAGPHLGALAAELAAVHETDSDSVKPEERSLDEVLGGALAEVLQAGLQQVKPEALQRLLQRPELLLELQARVLAEGGEYWRELLDESRELDEVLERGRQRLTDRFSMAPTARTSTADDESGDLIGTSAHGAGETVQQQDAAAATVAIPWYRRPLWVSAMTAAAVVLLMLGGQHWFQGPQPPAATAWGWNGPDAMPRGVSLKGYLEALAGGGQAWFNKRPDDAAGLAQRILEMRQGCNRLILADHSPLSAAEQEWLKDKCRAWAAKFDQQLAALEAGADVAEVRRAMDEIVTNLVKALRNGPAV